MKIALVAETFLPTINGVTHSLLRVLDHLAAEGHEARVLAPDSGPFHPHGPAPAAYAGAPITWLPSVALPGYRGVRLAAGGVARVRRTLEQWAPDVVHLAAPFVLGWRAAQAAGQLGLPSVAIYQTDVPTYAARYGLGQFEALLWRRVVDVHAASSLTLAPSTAACAQLAAHGVPRVRRWGRGVDAVRFAPSRRDLAIRSSLAPGGEVLVGYVGRLAAEKQVEDLRVLADLPGVRLVVIGDGPYRARLERLLPTAHFTGFLGGDALPAMLASLDVFVHPGELETFGQTLQEAMASGVPVVAVGRGGPVDLVDQSRTGWLYPPGDLAAFCAQVLDLTGDLRKRRAFGVAARTVVAGRTWTTRGHELTRHYADAIALGAPARGSVVG